MRLPYVPNPPPATNPQDAAIVQRIQARRAPRPLQPLDLALLHSPPVADGWNAFLGAVRTQTLLAADLRELAVARVAVVNGAWYEWAHHAPLAVQAGVPEEVVMRGVVRHEGRLGLGEWEEKGRGLGERQWVALVFADEMTRNVRVEDATFRRAQSLFEDREVVELVATVSSGPVSCQMHTGRVVLITDECLLHLDCLL